MTRSNDMLTSRDSLYLERHTQTMSAVMEMDSSSKDNQKKTKKTNSQTNKGWLYLKTNFKLEMVKREGHYYYGKGIINPSRRFNKWEVLTGAQKKTHNIKQLLME